MRYTLYDEDADGILEIDFSKKYSGMTITVTDEHSNVSATGTFYKSDVRKLLEKIVKALDQKK